MDDDLNQVPWGAYAQPEGTKRGEVAETLRALGDANSPADGAYDAFLYAIGNHHCGSYWPVVLPAIPFVGALLRSPHAVVRIRALDVLLDLVGTFCPDPAHTEVETMRGRKKLDVLVREAAAHFRDDVARLCVAEANAPPNTSKSPEMTREEALAQELLELLPEPAPPESE